MNEHAVAFYIGKLPITWYGLLVTLGFTLATIFAYIEWRKKGYDNYKWGIIFTSGAVVSLFGARWWYLMFNPSDYQGFISIFWISSGRSILGSIFFVAAFFKFYTKYIDSEIEFRMIFSIIFPHMLLGQAIGRWGNFYNGDVYGLAMSNPNIWPSWIMDHMYYEGAYRHPLFLYEFFINMFGWVTINFIMKNIKWFKPGTHGSMYFIWYGITRSIMEPQRDPKFIMNLWGMKSSFVMAIVLTLIGVALFIYYQFYFEGYDYKFQFYYPWKLSYLKSLSLIWIKNIRNKVKRLELYENAKEKYNNNINSIDQKEVNEYINRKKRIY